MPELPEVETVRRGLEQTLLGKQIESVTLTYPKMVLTGSDAFTQALVGATFQALKRCGKYLLFDFGEQVMISHLRMEGKYHLFEGEIPTNKHFHVFFKLTDGSTLVYQDVRKFGTMELLKSSEIEAYFAKRHLGPEPTSSTFKLASFQALLAKSRQPIKSALLAQKLVAGLGNIYADEVLWLSFIHPKRPCNSLTKAEVKRLHQEIILLLQLAIEKGGSTIRTYQNTLGQNGSMQDYLKVYGQTGLSCHRCATPIEKIKLAGRGTHYCPKCQKEN